MLASVSQSDIKLVREIILSIDTSWVKDNITLYIAPILEKGTEEEYRRVAELYYMLDKNLLENYLDTISQINDTKIQEIVNDFN